MMMLVVVFLFLKEWRNNKNSQKRVSFLALGCFLFAVVFFLPEVLSDWILALSSIFLSIILGVIFMYRNKKEKGRLIGYSLSVIGLIISGTVLVLVLFSHIK